MPRLFRGRSVTRLLPLDLCLFSFRTSRSIRPAPCRQVFRLAHAVQAGGVCRDKGA